MKKFLIILLVLSVLSLYGCSSSKQEEIIDLTGMTSIMSDSYMSNMISNFDDYKGKVIKVKGEYKKEIINNTTYHICMFQSSCCPYGIEFISKDNKYPEENSFIIIQGNFNRYGEENNGVKQIYYNLLNAEFKIS